MGIYPGVEFFDKDGRPVQPEALAHLDQFRIVTTEPGLVTTSFFKRYGAVEDRTDCFCCSCMEDDYGHLYTDAACRNHGFAARRPCDIHNLPGQSWDDTFPEGEGEMPTTVLQARAGNR